jgi:hypothetical protein
MEQDYVFSLNYHSKNPETKVKMLKIQEDISNELFTPEEINPVVPESLTKEKTIEIRNFARDKTSEIMQQSQKGAKDQNQLQDILSFEIAKLDDVIYIEFGYKNKVVIEAFKKYDLLPQAQAPVTAPGPEAAQLVNK